MAHRYGARVAWQRRGATFSDNRYSRGHEWSFDGGVTVPASSSPLIVPRDSVEHAVDPEEALVASASSCHMLWFLSLAAGRGYVVDSYVDEASGIMEKDARGRMAITRITLRPRVEFSGDSVPDGEAVAVLHREAHEACFIANSLRSEIVVEA